jgi:hypothetical protein
VFVHVESHELRDVQSSLGEDDQPGDDKLVVNPGTRYDGAHLQSKEASFSSLSDTYDHNIGSAV